MGTPCSAGTCSPSKTTINMLDQVFIPGGSVLASSLLEGSWLGAGQQWDSGGLWPPWGLLAWLGPVPGAPATAQGLGRAEAQELHPVWKQRLKTCLRLQGATQGEASRELFLPFTSAWTTAEPFSCCPSLGTPGPEQRLMSGAEPAAHMVVSHRLSWLGTHFPPFL